MNALVHTLAATNRTDRFAVGASLPSGATNSSTQLPETISSLDNYRVTRIALLASPLGQRENGEQKTKPDTLDSITSNKNTTSTQLTDPFPHRHPHSQLVCRIPNPQNGMVSLENDHFVLALAAAEISAIRGVDTTAALRNLLSKSQANMGQKKEHG